MQMKIIRANHITQRQVIQLLTILLYMLVKSYTKKKRPSYTGEAKPFKCKDNKCLYMCTWPKHTLNLHRSSHRLCYYKEHLK